MTFRLVGPIVVAISVLAARSARVAKLNGSAQPHLGVCLNRSAEPRLFVIRVLLIVDSD